MKTTSSQNFININKSECAKVYPVVMKNANTHFRCADILAEAGEYANAVAHLILGTEEMIKALLLFLESKNFALRNVEGYNNLFRNHRARHSIIKEFYSIVMTIKSLISIKGKEENENLVLYCAKVLKDVIYTVKFGMETYAWWDNADGLKQECFYVDYKGSIIDPQSISLERYEKAYNYISSLKNEVGIIIDTLTRADKEQLNDFRRNFENANFKDLLAGTIKRSKKP